MSSTLSEVLVSEIAKLLAPINDAVENPYSLDRLLAHIGAPTSVIDNNALIESLGAVVDLKSQLDKLAALPEPSLDSVAALLDVSRQMFTTVRSLSELGGPVRAHENLGQDLVDFLVTSYLARWRPLARNVAALATLLELAEDLKPRPAVIDGDQLLREPFSLDRFHLDRLVNLVRDPAATLRGEYGNSLATVDDASAMAQKLFPRLQRVLRGLGVSCRYGFDPDDEALLGDAAPLLKHALIVYADDLLSEAPAEAGVALNLSSADQGDLGLVVSPFGALTSARQAGRWAVDLMFTAGVDVVAYGRHGLTLLANAETTEVSGGVSATLSAPSEGPAFIFGAPNGTRIEVGGAQLRLETSLSEAKQSLAAAADVSSSALVIVPGDGDGFLSRILPSDGMRADFDLGLAWSNERGLTLRGSAGMDATIPIGLSIGGVSLSAIHLSLQARDAGLSAEVSATAGVSLGPVQAVVDRIGIAAAVTFPENGGNLGPVDLNIDFKPPSAVGLSVDAEGITGGGFLRIDPPNYAGVLELSFQNQIDLTAFGLITTRLPDGRPGFSLVIAILAEFQPIQLGLGFALTGVGGLIAINRQFNEEALQLAFKNHSLDAILFPQNPIKDAVKLIESIQSILPPREGYHVFGPMAKLFWGGSRRLVNFEIGIFIQIGGPLKIVLIGQAWSRLPTEDSPQLVINVDVLGIIDFGEQRVAIDATLFDSHILDIRLDGQMALRADWSKGEENFALSVGGFHPQFQQIPPGFPQLRRLAMVIGDNPRLSLTMYLAITTNTLQVGAKLELWADKLGFTITGGASFDALFTFIPFSFLVNIKVWVSVKRGGIDLGLWLELELSGPNPIIASGYVKIKLGGLFSFNVKFRAEFGIKIAEPLPAVSPLGVLKAELQNPRAIRPQMPAWASANMTFAETGESKIDPIADLIIVQSAVPLNFDLEKFGGGVPPAAERRLKVTTGSVAGERAAQSLFAPEQFKNWTAEQRLSAKPFEKFDAGIGFGGEYVIPAEHQKEREIVFETILRESQEYLAGLPEKDYRKVKIRTACLWQPQAPEVELFNNWSRFGAGSYYRPRRAAKDDSNPNYVKVAEFNW